MVAKTSFPSWQLEPKVPLLIGVTGHRDIDPKSIGSIGEKVADQLRELLKDLPHTPLRLLCGMAQGADLLVADQALAVAREYPGRVSICPILASPADHFLGSFTTLSADSPYLDRDKSIEIFKRVLRESESSQLAPAFAGDSLPEADDHKAWTIFLKDDAQRHRRYEEVGAAIALFGQMTFALWDGEKSGKRGGTDQVVEWCLTGIPETIYPRGLEHLGTPPQTVVVRIHTPRSGRADELAAGTIEWLWSRHGSEDVVPARDSTFRSQLSKRLRGEWNLRRAEPYPHKLVPVLVFCALEFGRTVMDAFQVWNKGMAWNSRRPHHLHTSALHSLEHLNEALEEPSTPAQRKKAVEKHFGDGLDGKLSSRLQSMALLRSRVGNAVYPKMGKLRVWFGTIFVIIAFSAWVGHHYVGHQHWDHEHGKLQHDPLWLGMFIVLTLLAWIAGWALHLVHYEARTLDLRAVAEAFRVQVYWALGGLRDSVPAAYSQRQRGELQWIRAAVRGAALPYDLDAEEFERLPFGDKIERLKAVRTYWIDEQRAYFLRRFREYRTNLIFTKWFGLACALAGWLLGLSLLIFSGKTPGAWTATLAGLLIVGGVTVAYSENRRFPELAFSFERMHRVYDDALNRFDALLAKATAAEKVGNVREQEDVLRHAETLLRALGREALSENADWLTLSRARPFETPVH